MYVCRYAGMHVCMYVYQSGTGQAVVQRAGRAQVGGGETERQRPGHTPGRQNERGRGVLTRREIR